MHRYKVLVKYIEGIKHQNMVVIYLILNDQLPMSITEEYTTNNKQEETRFWRKYANNTYKNAKLNKFLFEEEVMMRNLTRYIRCFQYYLKT